MKSLYRRYRPVTLSEVVGQPQVTGPLIKSLEQGKISHAYLFIGPRGCGKTSVARILAHEVNKFKYKIEDDYVDIIEIDGASNRGIDNIRELREKVAIAPTSGKYKVYIIDEVHMLTKEAFNALLKTLEEPPRHAIFIMATTDAYKVPVTITSRAQTYTFKLADHKVMFDFLKGVATKEKIPISDGALKIIVKRGGGSFRDSLSLLDQISTLSSEKISEDMVISALGLPQEEKINELLDKYIDGSASEMSDLIKELLSSGIKAETLSDELIAKIIAEPKPILLPLLAKLPEIKAPYAEAKLLLALCWNKLPSASTTVKTPMQASAKQLQQNVKTPITKQQVDTPKKSVSAEKPSSHVINFNWESFVERVQSLSDAVYSQLLKVKHSYSDETLHIYPPRKIVQSILSRENNKKILYKALNDDVKITIHNYEDTPEDEQKDDVLTKISDIMGGEVTNDGGNNPF